jgi:phosphoglycolate phosphatase
VVKRTRTAKAEVIRIGDEPRDIEAASNAGLASGAVIWGYATAEVLEQQKPTMLFSRMGEIVDKLTACKKRGAIEPRPRS